MFDPIAWVNRHRLHHKHADHPGDPNKLSGDGFWRTLYLCVDAISMQRQLAGEEDFKVSDFSNRCAPVFCNTCASLQLLCLMEVGWRSEVCAGGMWVGIRIFATVGKLIQNYWTHTRNFGYRRYDMKTTKRHEHR